MVARATAASSSELTAHLGGQLTQALASQSEQQNFNRKVSQSSITNGAVSDASRLAAVSKAVATPVTTALEAQAQAVKALQSKASATSMAISADPRKLADSFDSLKKLSDRLPDSMSMEKLNDRDLLNINLTSGDSAPRDPNVKVFEHNETFSSSNKKLVTNDFSTEEATANREETTHLQEGDNSYSEKQASSDMRAKLEMNGITAEKGLSTRQVSTAIRRRLRIAGTWHVLRPGGAGISSGISVDNWLSRSARGVLLNGMSSAGNPAARNTQVDSVPF